MSEVESKDAATAISTDAALLSKTKADNAQNQEVQNTQTSSEKAGSDDDQNNKNQEQTSEQESAKKSSETNSEEISNNSSKEYQLKLPVGSLLKPEQIEKISSYSKEKGFSEADAQALLERESALLSEFQSEQIKALEEARTQWIEQVKIDKEIGGIHFEKNLKLAQSAVSKFATPEFKKALDDSGFGNHPELVRVFARIGKAMSSDSLVRGSDVPTKKSVEELLYGTSNTNT